MTPYSWKPIEPLSNLDRAIDLASIRSLYESWRQAKHRFEGASPGRLQEFNQRLIRRLSIETGILENLYSLDRGTTEALVMQGFAEELVTRSSTDVEPGLLIDILRDHEAAARLIVDSVAGNRPLSKGLMHELHRTLTDHQSSTVAIDQLGVRRDILLEKGKFKRLPNNPRRPGGEIHEYCPPIQVDSEIERMIGWLTDYVNEDPVITAAWLHHRFTQIHPYQDGNGRVARALTMMVLLRAGLLPLVIDRDIRAAYIEALERADAGNLDSLIQLFARMERGAILQALSVDTEVEINVQRSLAGAVIDSLAEKFGKRRIAKLAELRHVNDVAAELRSRAHAVVAKVYEQLRWPASQIAEPDIFISDGGPDHDNAYWYRAEVVKAAREAGKFANLVENHYFVRGTIRVDRERLVFVVSLHHLGRELTGVMEAAAFALLQSFDDSDESHREQEYRLCALEPFPFTYLTNASDIADSFDRWLDAALAVALKDYGDRL